MKRNRLILSGSVIAATGFALLTAFVIHRNHQSLYHPSSSATDFSVASSEDQDAAGAAQYWFNLRKDPATGQLNYASMIEAMENAKNTFANAAARNSSSAAVASTMWTELGPDNVGGRTRAIVIDNLDHNHMYAGGVSGGVWESNDGSNTWHPCGNYMSVAGASSGMPVSTIAQAPNGDLYVGTGEGIFYGNFGLGSGGFVGYGIFKSTDRGQTWAQLPSTAPTSLNNPGLAWVNIGRIAVDPNNSSHVFAATQKGLKYSNDGGTTWQSPSGPVTLGVSNDVDFFPNGNVIAVVSNKPWLSTDGGQSFINVGNTSNGFYSGGAGRVEVAIAPSDPNYVYAIVSQNSGALGGVYASVDGGNNWNVIAGTGNPQFDPFGGENQGTYDLAIDVDSFDKGHIIIGGVELWEWRLAQNNPPAGQWNRIASEFDYPGNAYYVHADKHIILFHPTQQNTVFIGCDGGIFKSHFVANYGMIFTPQNKGYNVTQCYGVAFDHTDGNKSMPVAGCQDNGTQFINGLGNTSKSAISIDGGDGADCDFSFLNNNAIFTTIYYGSLKRTNNRGQSFGNMFYSANITRLSGFLTNTFANFVTPIRLWESLDDQLSPDSVRIPNGQQAQSIGVTDGIQSTYTGTLVIAYPQTNPSATIVLDSVMFVCGPDTVYSDAGGNLSGAATGTVSSNGNFTVNFTTTPAANRVLKAFYYGQYSAGTVFTVTSNVQGRNLDYTTPVMVNPNDTVKIQDVIQSRLAVGFTGGNGVWVTRRPIDFSTTPQWFQVGASHSVPTPYTGTASCITWSPNGNNLYVGTDGGRVYRFANVGLATDTINGNANNTANTAANPSCVVQSYLIASYGGRYVSAIDVDPNNPQHVVITLANYGNVQYVYYSGTADTATSTAAAGFLNKTGNLNTLGGAPTYAVSFDKYTTNRVLVGTDHGMFETSNITSGSPTWVSANAGFDNTIVDMIRQERWDPWLVPDAGCFYIGSHGRGMWRDDSSLQISLTGVNSPTSPSSDNSQQGNHDLKVFPNPVVDNSSVAFRLAKAGSADVMIFDLGGKLVYSKKYDQLVAGTNTVQFDAQSFDKGTYIIMVMQDSKRIGAGRFVKMN